LTDAPTPPPNAITGEAEPKRDDWPFAPLVKVDVMLAPTPPAPTTTSMRDPAVTDTPFVSVTPPPPPPPPTHAPPPPPPPTARTSTAEIPDGTVHVHVPAVWNSTTVYAPDVYVSGVHDASVGV
jgi:hypothetical protein